MTARRNPQRSAAVALLGATALHLALIASAMAWLAPLLQSNRPDRVLMVALQSTTVSAPAAPPHAGSHALPAPVRPQKPQPRRPAPARKPAAPASNPPPVAHASSTLRISTAMPQPITLPDPAAAKNHTPDAAPTVAIEAPQITAKTGVAIPAAYATRNRKPEYPLMSRRFNEQGTAVLRVLVTADGSAGDVQIVTSSGHALLDQSALTAVRNWRFVAATQDGKAVSEWYQISIPYTLQD